VRYSASSGSAVENRLGNVGMGHGYRSRSAVGCPSSAVGIVDFLLPLVMVSVVRYGVGVRRTVAAAALVLALIVFAPRAGEPDRTESIAIGTLRAVVSGEKAYASANNGYFDTPACLAAPSCVPGTDRRVQPFLAPGVATGSERRGYQVQFHPGPKAERESARQSPTAMTRFAVVAVPTDPITSRRRAFCADDRGTIYVTAGGTRPHVDVGRCLDTSSPFR
jgi:hypothetical protein